MGRVIDSQLLLGVIFMRFFAVLAISVFLFAPGLFGQAKRVDDAMLKNAAKTASDGDWLSYGLTPGETRYSPLKQIDASNVKRLGLMWSYEVGDGGGDQEATPLVWNNTIYGVTNWSIVFAVDARTGKEKWRWDPLVNRKPTQDKLCCGVVNRGLALYHNKVYVPVNDGRLVALDTETGKPVWEARVAWTQDEQTLTMAPRIAKGKVIVGAAGGDRPSRGFFAAYDAETGREAWKFWTVPGDPAKGFESSAMRKAAATWDGDWWKLGGGGSVWDGISYDPETDLLYVGTGNAEPWPQALRTKDVSTGHDNLYVASIVAVHVETGELKWHYQMVPGDEWDYDSVQQMTLADLNINGKTRKVIMQANKNGFFYVLDRKTGQFIQAKQYVPQNWAYGLDPKTGRPIEHKDIRYSTTGKAVVMMPGPDGAHSWHAMAYNPKTGLVYIPAQEIGKSFTPIKDFKTSEIGWNLGVDVAGTPGKKKGYLLAWDPVAEKEVWRSEHIGPWNGGIVTTAGNLVIQGDATGHLNAYRADNGEKLWSIDCQSPIMAAPVTYEVNGEQYIAVLSGFGSAFSLQAGEHAAQSGNIRNISRVLAFKVGGTATLPEAPSMQKLALNPPPATADAATVSAGDHLFGRYCAACHGENAVGGGVVPDLRASSFLGNDFFYEIVLNGAMKDAGMAPFKAVLDQKDATAIRAYLIKRANEDKVKVSGAK